MNSQQIYEKKEILKSDTQMRRDKILGLDHNDKKAFKSSPLGKSWSILLPFFDMEYHPTCPWSNPCSREDQTYPRHVNSYHQAYSCETCMKRPLMVPPSAFTRYSLGDGHKRTFCIYHCNPVAVRAKNSVHKYNTLALLSFMD